MIFLNDVTQVNNKYIFIRLANGTQDRMATKRKDLEQLYEDVLREIDHLRYMMDFTTGIRIKKDEELQNAEKLIEQYEGYIIDHTDDPLIRRNLHDVCFARDNTINMLRKLCYENRGVMDVYGKALTRLLKLEKLQREIEAAMKEV